MLPVVPSMLIAGSAGAVRGVSLADFTPIAMRAVVPVLPILRRYQ